MKSFNLCICLLFLLQTVLSQNTTNWRLIWSDEFNGSSLDLSKWSYSIECRGRNKEAQCYTNRESNVRVSNGNLIITAVPEYYNGTMTGCTETVPNFCQAPRSFTSGRIHTRYSPTGSWTFGKFEIRSKLPKGDYLWPALWMMPTDEKYGSWAASGEIDIMEMRGQDPYSVEGTLHYGSSFPYTTFSGSGPRSFHPADLSADFHIYTLEWTADSMKWFVDGTKYYEENLNRNFYFPNPRGNPYTANRQPFDQRFYFLINMAVGGSFFGGAVPTYDQGKTWPIPQFMVDYVRVYQQQQ